MKIYHMIGLLLLLFLLCFYCAHIGDAQKAFDKKDYKQALALCKAAIKTDSSDTNAYLLMSHIYIQMDSLNKALQTVQILSTLPPNSQNHIKDIGQIYFNLGTAWEEKNNPVKIRSMYLEAEKIQPDRLDVKQRLADIYFSTGNLDEASLRYNRLIEMDSDISEYVIRLNQIEKREQSAQQYFEKGLRYYKQEQFRSAEIQLSSALNEKSVFPIADYYRFLSQGRFRFNQNLLQSAQSFFVKASDVLPEKPEPYYWLAQVYEKMGSEYLEKTISTYRKVLQYDSDGSYSSKIIQKLELLKRRKSQLNRK